MSPTMAGAADLIQLRRSSTDSRSSPDQLTTDDQNEFAYKQMEKTLRRQAQMCAFYKYSYGQQLNESMCAQFDTYLQLTLNDMTILGRTWTQNKELPKFKFKTINLFCRPCNFYIDERELKVEIRTNMMPVKDNLDLYVIGEYGAPTERAEQPIGTTVNQVVRKFFRSTSTESLSSFFGGGLQLDKVCASPLKPFWDMRDFHTSYIRSIRFAIDENHLWGVVKLTFYERRAEAPADREIGSVRVGLDCLRDRVTSVKRLPIKKGSIDTGGGVEIKLSVQTPLVDKSMRYFKQQLLIIT